MTHIYISVHPVSHRLEWRGWGDGSATPTSRPTASIPPVVASVSAWR